MGQMTMILQEIARLKQTLNPDLIHIDTHGPGTFFHLRTTNACPVPTLVTVHALMTGSCAGDTIIGRLLRSADWVSTVSESALCDLRRVLPDITGHSSVIYNGLEMPSIQPGPLPTEQPRLLCIGRMIADKGFDRALIAFSLLAERFPRARLVIAGDGPAKSGLMELTTELGLTDSVEFTGSFAPEKIPELINTATVVIMPSRLPESFGLVALQAAQMARPVVATRVGGLPEVVTDGETGLLVEKDNADALSEAIAFLLERPETALRMGRSAYSRAREVFGWERFLDEYDVLYRRVIGKMSAQAGKS